MFQQLEGIPLTKRPRCWLWGEVAHPELESNLLQDGNGIPGGTFDCVCYNRHALYLLNKYSSLAQL